MPRHKHADLIIAWANGAKIEYWHAGHEKWLDIDANPSWWYNVEYRIKPEPKPDIVRYARASFTEYHFKSFESMDDNKKRTGTYWSINKSGVDNIKATFDGETGELKKVEIIK